MAKLKLKGSCHCHAVKFELKSDHIFPYQRCYCSICRKTQGGGGWSINISGDANTLKVRGCENIKVYRAKLKSPGDKRAHTSTGERNFCSVCGSGLWMFDPEWPDLIHPFASAIDSPLPVAPEHTHLMLKFKPKWVEPQTKPRDKKFQVYPKESIAEWHKRLGVEGKAKAGGSRARS